MYQLGFCFSEYIDLQLCVIDIVFCNMLLSLQEKSWEQRLVERVMTLNEKMKEKVDDTFFGLYPS